VAEHLYKEVPDSNFTRSISNPEIVMARRRQQKLENKLKLIKNRDGGGTLKIYGETLKPDIPYKTLLMSNQDVASFAVKETLEKYSLPNEDPDNYCLVQVGLANAFFYIKILIPFSNKIDSNIPEDPVFSTRCYLCFFIFLSGGSTWY
jgi:hypothetical protein